MSQEVLLTFGNYLLGSSGSLSDSLALLTFTIEDPFLVFEFSESSFVPTSSLSHNHGTWTRVSTSPNRWKWSCAPYQSQSGTEYYGWQAAFSSTATIPVGSLTTSNLGGGTCSIIASGGDFRNMQTIDRTFANCTALTSFAVMRCLDGVILNSSGTYSGCTGVVDSSAVESYNYMKSLSSPPSNHSGMFSDCGSSTYLAEIPSSWGGTYIPPSTLLDWSLDSTKASWSVQSFPGPTSGGKPLSVFTTASVSAYAGVSMNRTRCYNKINSFSTATSSYMYFRPAFFYLSRGTTPGPSTTSQIGWLLTSTGYNGVLTPNQGSTDMPGTLDYSAYGPLNLEYGTYSDWYSNYIKFGFLVTNVPSSSWNLSKGSAFLYNSNFKTDDVMKYFYGEG